MTSPMKVFLYCVVFAAVLALAKAESCSSTSDCDHVTCPESDYTLECHTGQCTCTHNTLSCTSQQDCSDGNCFFGWHCVDSRCRCGFGFGGGK